MILSIDCLLLLFVVGSEERADEEPVSEADCEEGRSMTARNSRSSFSVRSTMVVLCNSASLTESRLERPDILLEGLDFGVAHALTFPVLLDLTLDVLEISAM